MAPKNVRNWADKSGAACQGHVGKEGSDGRLTGKRLTGGSSKISCKTSCGAGAGVVKDGRDHLKEAQSDTKTGDRSQSKTQPIITDFLTHGDRGSAAAGPIPLSKDVPSMVADPVGGIYHDEKGSEDGKGLTESSPDLDKSQGYVEGRGDGIKNPEQQVNSTTLHIIREQEERPKDTHNLINECPETRQEKGIEWEKEKSMVGEGVAKDWTFETRKVENDGKNTDWS
ncbi:hypothetical protein NDU88_001927 [Pleurodeles waltl]|uniref:Uncharacterized protein n=1 Tax=Pleurodeles waltl TaxID=8319 RepID=A0AAV7TJ80_PLEWA|nr:hypothetical protein NDU88_001927 [Pleurodeles waltl]